MKRFLFCLLCVLGLQAEATNALLDLKDARLSVGVYSNRTVVLQPMSTPTVSSPSVVLGGQIVVTNDINGQNWYSNIYSGLYHVIVLAPPDRADFAFLVTATNLGNINVADNLVAASTATFPAGSVAWAAAVSDQRYARGSNQSVSFSMITNGLGYTPQPSAPNLTNWSNVTTNSLLTLPYIANNGGSGTNTILDYPSSSDYSTFIHPYSTTGTELLYQKNDLSSAVMLWRNIGSQLYITAPIITGGTLAGGVTVTGTISGNGSGLTNLTPQSGFQFGSSVLTNLATGNNIIANTLLGTDAGKNPVSYVAGTDITVSGGAVSSTAAATVTNGLGLALSNYVSAVSLNATNQSLKIGGNDTNNDLVIGLGATNQSLLIGSGATNEALLIGSGATNEALLIGLGATNEAARIGNNATNYTLTASNSLKAYVDLGNLANTLALFNYSNTVNATKQAGSSVLTNISGASGTPSSTTFLRGDYSWQTPVGVGTVTSVGLTMPGEFAVSGSPITSSGSFTVAKQNQSPNLVYAGPSSGGSGAPTFRALVTADLPTIPTTGWQLTGNAGTTAGANFIGTTDGQPLSFKVNSGQVMILRADGVVIGQNSAGAADAVLGGHNNVISSVGSTYNVIAGGVNNVIVPNTGGNSILGGSANAINSPGAFATVAGGQNNTASGSSSFIAGGNGNVASGLYAFAAGNEAHAVHQGSFVMADSQSLPLSSTNNDSFNIRAHGGVILYQSPLFAQTNYAPYSTLTNPVTSGASWANSTGARVLLCLNYTLTSTNGFPGLCFTNLTTGEWFNATNSVTNSVFSGRTDFILSPNDTIIVTNRSSSSASASLDASWAKMQ